MKKLLFSIYLLAGGLLLLTNSLFGIDRLDLNLDIRQFRFQSDTTLVEVYYGLTYLPDTSRQPENNTSSFVLSFTVLENERIVVNNIWTTDWQRSETNDHHDQRVMIDILRYLLAPGRYDFKIVGKHLSLPDLIDSVTIKNVTIKPFRTEKVEMSDIELAQQITPSQAEEKDRFHKNNYRVLPNPLNVYGENNGTIYYYLELYNLSHIKTDYFSIRRTILDDKGLPLASLPVYTKKKRIRGDDAIEVGMFDCSQLPSGRYFLNFATLDSSGKEFAAAATGFYVYNPAVIAADRSALPLEQLVATSEIALLPAEEMELVIGATKYLAMPDEIKVMNNLTTDQAKKMFLYRFWQDRDTDKNTVALESFREVMRRIRYANENFQEIKVPGWRSDRGRILIIYGKPSLIQYYPNVSGFREFQAWSYDDVEKGVCFIFGVMGGFGDLKLVHSTKTGEKYNEYWLDLLKITTGTTGMVDDMNSDVGQRENYREIFRRHNLEFPRYLR